VCSSVHVARKNKKKKEELKQRNASAHLVQYRFKIREGIRVTMEIGGKDL